MRVPILVIFVLSLVAVACGNTAPRELNLYPTVTVLPTQTPAVVIWTQTPNATQTPIVVIVSATPNSKTLCVSALEAVYLRPSPSSDNYPIQSVPNRSAVIDLGGRSGDWYFVRIGDKDGWIHSKYISGC